MIDSSSDGLFVTILHPKYRKELIRTLDDMAFFVRMPYMAVTPSGSIFRKPFWSWLKSSVLDYYDDHQETIFEELGLRSDTGPQMLAWYCSLLTVFGLLKNNPSCHLRNNPATLSYWGEQLQSFLFRLGNYAIENKLASKAEITSILNDLLQTIPGSSAEYAPAFKASEASSKESIPSKEPQFPHIDEISKSAPTATKTDLTQSADGMSTDANPIPAQAFQETPMAETIKDNNLQKDTILTSHVQSPAIKKNPRQLAYRVHPILLIVVCILCVVAGYLTGGGYLSESLVPNSPYIQKLKAAESTASSKSYKKGYNEGRDDGYKAGRKYGYNKGYRDGSDDTLFILSDHRDQQNF